MPVIQVEAHVSGQELLRAAAQLEAGELDQLVTGVLRLRAERQAPRVSADEGGLLLRINRGLPETLRRRSDELIAKRRAENLTADEHQELLRLSDEIERYEADRVEALAQLAQKRGTTLAELMATLHIPAPSDD